MAFAATAIVGCQDEQGGADESTTTPLATSGTAVEADPFRVATRIEGDRLVFDRATETFSDPDRRLLTATCMNYADWLSDEVVEANLVYLDQAGLIRSAELLSGDFADNDVALQAESAYMQNDENEEQAMAALRDSALSAADLEVTESYLSARSELPGADAIERFITYAANLTTTSYEVVRAEVPPEVPLVDPPALTRTGDISVLLNDGRTIAIDEQNCWRDS